jgi:TRAP-type C4-dicarboxylate transport system permease small subunit
MERILSRLNRLFAELCGWFLIVVMVLLISDFVSRGISLPLVGVAEIAVFVMISVVFLGLGHCEEQKGHVRVEAVLVRLPPKARGLLNLFCYLLGGATIGVTLYAVVGNAVDAFWENEAIAGPTPLPTYPVKFVMVVSLALYLVQLCMNALEQARDISKETG